MSKAKSFKNKLAENAAKLQEIKKVNASFDPQRIKNLQKKFKETIEDTKREAERCHQASIKKKAGTTRSGKNRGIIDRPVYTTGDWISRGLDDGTAEKFADDEKEYLKKGIRKFKELKDLKSDHIRYLVMDEFLDELKKIKDGTLESRFHDLFVGYQGRCKTELLSEVKTSLFTNEQRDYVFGLLQAVFNTTSKDEKGDIKHALMDYVMVVMVAEATIRLVKYVYKLNSNEEADAFMQRKSREAHGCDIDID